MSIHLNENIFVYLIAAFFISFIPIVGRYVSIINTLVHENGHALAALLFNGKVYSIKLYQNTAGEAVTGHSGWIATVVTIYAGYTFSSLAAYICFFFLSIGKETFILYTLIALAVLNLFLWIRNFYGGVWLITFIVICGWSIYSNSIGLQRFLSYFLSAVLLTQSISSAFHIFFLSVMKRKRAGDATSLAQYTKLPAAFWGFLFFAQAVYIGYSAILRFMGY